MEKRSTGAVRLLEQYVEVDRELNKLDSKINSPVTATTQEDVVFHKKITFLIGLLSPLMVSPQANGEHCIKYAVENKLNREQIEDWMMKLTKEHLKL